jgi:hypothetical protein
MRRAWGFVTGETRSAWKAQVEEQMRAAAGRLEFEVAGRLKKQLARAGALEGRAGEATALVRSLDHFSFVSLQPGKGKPWLEPWLVHGGLVEPLPQVHKKTLEAEAAAIYQRHAELARRPVRETIGETDMAALEQIGLVAHHLFRGEDDHGIWLGADALDSGGPGALVEAAAQLWARKNQPKPLVEVSTEKPVEDARQEALEASPAQGAAPALSLPVIEAGPPDPAPQP